MPNYTYEASRVSEHSYAGGVTPLTLSTVDQSGPNPFRGDCPDHGVHTALEVEEQIVIEREDDTWRLPETYNVSYCEECVGEFRNEARLLEVDSLEAALETEEADVVDVAKSMIELNWRHLRGAFRPDDTSNLETIPVGGEEA
jgi:hypothetical protein